MLDIAAIRKDFPILSREVNGKLLVYLDNAATSQKPSQVIQALVEYYEQYNSNIHRGVHTLSMEATEKYEEARQKCADFIGSPSTTGLVLVRNTTEGINLVAQTWARSNIGPGDEILISEMEHHSNLVPWQKVAEEQGATLRFMPLTPDQTIDLSNLNSLLTERTKLLTLTQMSNVLGTINPVKELTEAAHRVGARVLIDGAQSVPHLKVDVKDLDCDFFAYSGHKMLGPTGIGALYVKEDVIEDMEPFLRGGEMVRQVWDDRATWNDLPLRFEAGTPNIADTIAMGAAIDYLNALGMDNVREHEIAITDYALNAFQEIEDVKVFGPRDMTQEGGIVSFHCDYVHPHDIGTMLDQQGHRHQDRATTAPCPSWASLSVPATARASFYVYNTEEEVDLLVDAVKETLRFFSRTPTRT